MKSYDNLIKIIKRLRGPGGCPWDIEQTPESMRGDLIEEIYELVQAINEKDPEHIKEEIGDVMLNASMVAYMHEQEALFTLDDVFNEISDKLVRRHPHVFGDTKVQDTEEVLKNWADIKVKVEGRAEKGLLDKIPLSFPPLMRANKIQKKVAKIGFEWPTLEGVWDKINEEQEEIKEVLANLETATDKENKEQLHNELITECGDLLFSVVNLCRKLKVDPSVALDKTNEKFRKRFNYVEAKMKEAGIEMKADELEQMDKYWEEAKNM